MRADSADRDPKAQAMPDSLQNVLPDSDSPRPGKPALRQDIEILRILSAFGIVWFHSGFDRTGIGYSGLVVFLVLSAYLAAARPPAGVPFGRILARRALRMLSPWAVWMAAYGIRNHIIDRNIVETDRGWINGVLAGTNIHLWYLPYMFAVTVGLDLAIPRLRRSWMGAVAAVGAIALLSTPQIWRPWAATHGYPTVQYIHGIAAIFAGVFLAAFNDLPKRWSLPLLAMLFATCAVDFWLKIEGVGTAYLTGIVLCSWVLLRPPKLPSRLDVRTISGCMFGVYLSHIFFDRWYYGFPRLPELAQPFLTFSSALLLTWALRRFLPRLARFAV